jgi:two-component system osmolarity sensor histidine kinase EnvZ
MIIDNIDERYETLPDLPLFNSWQDHLNPTGGNALLLRYQRQPQNRLWLLQTQAPSFSLGIPVGDIHKIPHLIRTIFLAGSLLSAITAFALARYLIAPLKALAEGARSIGRDISSVDINPRGPLEIRVVGQALNLMKNDLDRMIKSQEFLLAGISHDLRTPLTRIRLATELLSADADDLRQGMKDDIEEMNVILQRFIELARVNIEEAEPWQTGDMTPLLLDVAKKYRRADINLTLSLDKIPPVRYKPMALRRLLYNLIDNGVKHGGGKVKLSTRRQGNDMELYVADQGPGRPMTSAELLVFSELSEQHRFGSGLGLLIVQRIAHLHGAKLLLRNNQQGGAEVVLALSAYSDPGLPQPQS